MIADVSDKLFCCRLLKDGLRNILQHFSSHPFYFKEKICAGEWVFMFSSGDFSCAEHAVGKGSHLHV